MNQILEPNDIVVSEVGQNQMYCGHYLNIRKPRTWITSGGLGTMGFGFPASIGAALAQPEKVTIAIVGDGGFQMTLSELSTAVNQKLPIKILIINNGQMIHGLSVLNSVC